MKKQFTKKKGIAKFPNSNGIDVETLIKTKVTLDVNKEMDTTLYVYCTRKKGLATVGNNNYDKYQHGNMLPIIKKLELKYYGLGKKNGMLLVRCVFFEWV